MTGLYYKAGNNPWEVEGLPFDTCFLGISFFKTGLDANAATHTSLAQVFSGRVAKVVEIRRWRSLRD
jgi:hypothetical protein